MHSYSHLVIVLVVATFGCYAPAAPASCIATCFVMNSRSVVWRCFHVFLFVSFFGYLAMVIAIADVGAICVVLVIVVIIIAIVVVVKCISNLS